MLFKFLKRKNNLSHQRELNIQRPRELDRNFKKGGRSFYFFDFDDNIAVLETPAFIFHKDTGHEIKLSSTQFVEQSPYIGKSGPYKDYEINFDDRTGSFRCYRDQDVNVLHKLFGKKQNFVQDVRSVLGIPDFEWKGPSWNCFYHAVYNQRPVSLITARGHAPETLKKGFKVLIEKGYLPHEPNYLSIYPINNKNTQLELGWNESQINVPQLKRLAIRKSVDDAFQAYGYSEFHRFGMSDDDPSNVEMILEEMRVLKAKYPENSFFVIDTSKGRFLKREVFNTYTEAEYMDDSPQLDLL